MSAYPQLANKRFDTLQALRGIAALLVVLFHIHSGYVAQLNQQFWFNAFSFGSSGVDFFFVLSGFIIFYVHRKDIRKSNSLVSFLTKRFTRIYPIYWAVLGLKISASLLQIHNTAVSQKTPLEFIKAFLLIPQDRSVLDNAFLSISWTLSYEILFYLMFALAIALATKWCAPIIGAWVLITVANFVGIFNIGSGQNFVLDFLFGSHNIEFFLGCLAAVAFYRYRRTVSSGMSLFCIGMSLFFIAAVNAYFDVSEISRVIAYGVPSVLIVLGAVYVEAGMEMKVPKLLILLGNASYSIYLVHIFLITRMLNAFSKVFPEAAQNVVLLDLYGVVVTCSAVVFGYLVYLLIEKPLIHFFKGKLSPMVSSALSAATK